MRVVYASDDLGPNDQRLLAAAAASPHEVHLLTFCNRLERLPDWIQRDCPRVQVHHRRFEAYPEVPSGRGRLATALARRRDASRYLSAFALALKALKPDLVHAGWAQTTGYAAALAKACPVYLTPWGSDILVWPKHNAGDKEKARIALEGASAVSCDAEAVRQAILEIAPGVPLPIEVFAWGVDLDRFRPAADPLLLRERLGWTRSPVVVMTRQMMRGVYGVVEFAEGFGKVLERAPEARLLLVGDGPLRPRVEATLKPLGRAWHATGAVENARMPGHLQAADVYASFSSSDGSSVSLLEAMACGLPSVVTDLPANREWVEEGKSGFLVPVGDMETMAERLARLLSDPALRRRMGDRALETARARADWKVNAARMLDGYETAVRRSRRAS